MRTSWGHWKKLTMVVALTLISTGIAAQDRQPGEREQFMTAERSRAIQAELERIDANRSAWVNEFLGEWNRVLDPREHDIRNELGPIAMRAPAWQLYAASLVGDLRTMAQVMRGRRSAGQYINSIASPQRKLAPQPIGGVAGRPLLLGDINADLTFTPIAPCRVVDTRPGDQGPGVRTGLIAANGTRNFDLEDDAIGAGQGGGPFPCPGLPTASPAAWSINITVFNDYVSAGGVKAYGAGDPEPNTSVVNWLPGTTAAIANSVIVIGNHLGSDDITIKAFGNSTHVIIDVMGYFDDAQAATATVSRVAGTAESIPASSFSFVNGGACPAGTVLIGGEADWASGGNVLMGESRQLSATTWTMWMVNQDAGANSVTIYSRCMDAPVMLN